ncbi:unnamed protein product [Ectocarpus sp. 12 AP-2014]
MKARSSTCRCVRWAQLLVLSTCGDIRVWQAAGFGLGARPSVPVQQKQHTATCSATQVLMSESQASDRSSSRRGEGGAEPTGRGDFLRNSAAFLAGGSAAIAGATTAGAGFPSAAEAIGDLYEFKDQARFAQHATLQVPDMAAALKFYVDGVGMKVIRTRAGPLFNTTVVGFGPEALEVPPSFVFGVSSTNGYGGHFTLELNSQKEEEGAAENGEEDVDFFYDPGNGVQFLQIAVDSYRISQVVKAGGIIESGYGYLQVLAPGGLRLKLLSGSRRDPPMFLAVKVKDMKRSVQWYTDVAGMAKFPFPRAREAGSPFEPEQPAGSVFMAYEGEAFGVVLIPAGKGDRINPGSVVSVAILAEDVEKIAESLGGQVSVDSLRGGGRSVAVADPDGYGVKFVEYSDWRGQLPRLV